MERFVVEATLRASQTDALDYTTYVFEVDAQDPFYQHSKFVMPTRYPNWETRKIEIGETGYLHFIEVIAGEDKYWNGATFTPYNCSNWQFMNFIEKPKEISNKIIRLN